MLSTTESFGLYFDSMGFAAAKIAVRALRVQMMPALATDTVCCSIASCSMLRVFSSILSNSSMQQIPRSDRTKAPLSSMISFVSGSLVMYTVKPTAELPFPDVYIPRGANLWTNYRSCDFAVDGSPQSKTFISPLKRPRPEAFSCLLTPPKSYVKIPFFTS